MTPLTTLAELIKVVGPSVVLLSLFIWMIWYYVSKLAPSLDALKVTVSANQSVMEKLLEGNASAFRELSSSNHNVATALGLLTRTMEQQDGALEKHEQLSSYHFACAISKLEDNTAAINGIKLDLAKHVTQCDSRYGRSNHP